VIAGRTTASQVNILKNLFLNNFIKIVFFFILCLLDENSGYLDNRLGVYYTWCDNKVRELIVAKLLHISLLNITVLTFKVLTLGNYAPMPVLSPPFTTILELVLWNDLQSCRRITPDVISVIKMPSFQYFVCLREQKKVIGG
jgi:hypothetical protein